MGGEVGVWPIDKHGKAPGVFWGPDMPPPNEQAGNFADETLVQAEFVEAAEQIGDYNDGVAFTAPVGTFEDIDHHRVDAISG